MGMKRFVVLGFLASSLSLTACTPKENAAAKKQAPVNMLETFSKPDAATCGKKACITIQKASLGKVFLVVVSGRTSGATPQWYDLKPMVVTFEKDLSGNKLALVGQNYMSIYEEIKADNLIQTFNILAEDDKTITFDWGKGLETLVLESSYAIDAPNEEEDLTESSFESLPITDSFVRQVNLESENIEVIQLAKVKADKIAASGEKLSIQSREETLGLNIQIRAYNLGQEFKMKEADKTRRAGFFVTKATRKGMSGEVVNKITKWDLSEKKGPITVRISEAVPADYVQSVVEAALYWNKVLGREVIAVETNVPKDAEPKNRTITIRWINWLDSGAAYAIGQSDPLTGEVLRAQVFMPSVFTRVGSAVLLDTNGGSPVAVGAVACDFSKKFADLAELTKEASDSQRLRLAQDSVRSTVAHELGHALGMRHNFAGSFSVKASTQEVLNSAKTYLKTPEHQGLETSTSIMDYVSGVDEILMSAKIKNSALSYDKMAMAWAYSDDDKALDEKISGYCSDEDIGVAKANGLQIYGCERFDAGNNPLLRKYLTGRSEKDSLVNVLVISILGRLFPADSDKMANIDQVLKDTVKWAKADLKDDLKFVAQVVLNSTVDGNDVGLFASREAIKKGVFFLSKQNMDPMFREVRGKNLAEAGGYAGLVKGLFLDADGKLDMNWYDKQIDQLEKSGILAHGKTLSGREYAMTAAEQKKIIDFFRGNSETNKKVLIEDVLALLPVREKEVTDEKGNKSVIASSLEQGLLKAQGAAQLADIYMQLANASSGTAKIKVGQGLAKELTVTKPLLNAKQRSGFLSLLSSTGLSFDQALALARVKSEMVTELNTVVQVIDPNVNLANLKDEEILALAEKIYGEGLIDAAGGSWLLDKLVTLVEVNNLR
jgi:hypothetical protein